MAIQKRRTRMYEPWGYREENDYQSSAGMLGDDLEKFFARAEYNKKDQKIHFYNKDDEEKGSIDVTEFASSVIEDVHYDSTTKILTIKFANGDVININIAELIDENEFGNGLIVNDGIVSVLIDSTGDPYLTVGENGVKLSGVKGGFTKINSAITNINSAITNIEGDIVNINSSITEINSAITNIEGDIVNINSSITEINSSITEIQSAVTDTITDVNINEDGDLELMNYDELLDTVPLTDYYYTKEDISKKEQVVSAALNDLNDKKFDDAEYVNTENGGFLKFYSTNEGVKTEVAEVELDFDIDDYYTKPEIDAKEAAIMAIIEQDEETTSAALNDLNTRNTNTNLRVDIVESGITQLQTNIDNVIINMDNDYEELLATKFDDAKYEVITESGETQHLINFYADNAVVATIDASAFIKDGMVDNVEIKEIEDPQDTGSTITVLAITFNTDAGKEEIDIPLSDIFDPNLYYTKQEVDDRILWTSGTGVNAIVQKNSDNTASGDYTVVEGSGNTAIGIAAHAEGMETVASGNVSHTEGYKTVANQPAAHAEGNETLAHGSWTHAEGHGTSAMTLGAHSEGHMTLASGQTAHAEGDQTAAYGRYTHAEGEFSIASGESSHAEGQSSVANGDYSHAEGVQTEANGAWSHAEGFKTKTTHVSEHASGQYNVSNSASTEFGDSGNTLFSVGNGTSTQTHNAFEIRQNGDIYFELDGNDVNLQNVILEDERVTAEGLNDLDKRVNKFETMFEENEDGYIILPGGEY